MSSKNWLIFGTRLFWGAAFQALPQNRVKTCTALSSGPLRYVSCGAGPLGAPCATFQVSSGTCSGTMRIESVAAGKILRTLSASVAMVILHLSRTVQAQVLEGRTIAWGRLTAALATVYTGHLDCQDPRGTIGAGCLRAAGTHRG